MIRKAPAARREASRARVSTTVLSSAVASADCTEGPHKDIASGQTLFGKGQSLFARAITATARNDRKEEPQED